MVPTPACSSPWPRPCSQSLSLRRRGQHSENNSNLTLWQSDNVLSRAGQWAGIFFTRHRGIRRGLSGRILISQSGPPLSNSCTCNYSTWRPILPVVFPSRQVFLWRDGAKNKVSAQLWSKCDSWQGCGHKKNSDELWPQLSRLPSSESDSS